jgi:membrane protein DedA with SNARE-associated domain
MREELDPPLPHFPRRPAPGRDRLWLDRSCLVTILAGVVSAVESLEDAAHGLGLAGVMALESVVPPIPSEVVLPFAGSLVAGGQLSFLVVLLAATTGSVIGAWALYALGRFGGRPGLRRLGPVLHLDETRLARMEAWFARRGDWVVLVGRLVPGLRAVVSVPAGMGRMPLGRFLLLTAVGSMVWNAGLIGVGEALAAHWAEVAAVVAPASAYLLAVAAALLPFVWWLRRRPLMGVVAR